MRASEDEPPVSDDDGLLASFNKALQKYVRQSLRCGALALDRRRLGPANGVHILPPHCPLRCGMRWVATATLRPLCSLCCSSH